MSTKVEINLFDVSNWKPLTDSAFIESLCTSALTKDNPDGLVVEVQSLDGAGVRLIFLCDYLRG